MRKGNKFIVFLGLPGSGKGTQSKILTEEFDNFKALSSGDLIRAILKDKKNENDLYTKLHEIVSNGLLVDDKIIFEIVENEIYSWSKNLSFSSNKNYNFILDGFPRSLDQCHMLENFLANTVDIGVVSLVIFFNLKKRLAIKRLLDRVICKNCGSIQSVFGLKKNDIKNLHCRKCFGELIKRKDDNIAIIRKRLRNDKKIIDFLLKFYQNKGVKCLKINAALKINVLHKKIKNIIDLL